MAQVALAQPASKPLTTSRARSRRAIDSLATVGLWSAASTIVVLLLLFMVYIFAQGIGVISWHFLTGSPKAADAGGGVGPEIFNSFYILILTLLFTVPIAVAAGVYLQEYALPGRFRTMVQFSAESLATIPSIVMGLFGLLIFVQTFRWHFTALGGALTLTLLNLPALMRVTQQALEGVPRTFAEASMALGATKWQTILRAILPSAIGPLTTGVVLVSGRIFGETAALVFTAGASVSYGRSAYDFNPFHTAETLAVHLWSTHREALVPDADKIANGSALVLLAMVLIFNIVARAARPPIDDPHDREGMMLDAKSTAAPRIGDKLKVEDLNVYYGAFQAMKHANLDVPDRRVTALIGPSGCGKSTFSARAQPHARSHAGRPRRGQGNPRRHRYRSSIRPSIDPVAVRSRIGMVFQRPNPFPKSIFENVVYGPKIHGEGDRKRLLEIAEKSLRAAALWDEVKDRLHRSALDLSGGQQQRLCIARVLAVEPEVILMDETGLRTRPDRNLEDRGFDRRTQTRLHGRHRDALDAAGGRASRISRRSSCSAS